MGKRPIVFEIYDSKDGPRIRVLAGNGKILLSSEAYQSGKPERALETLLTNVEDENYVMRDSRSS